MEWYGKEWYGKEWYMAQEWDCTKFYGMEWDGAGSGMTCNGGARNYTAQELQSTEWHMNCVVWNGLAHPSGFFRISDKVVQLKEGGLFNFWMQERGF